VETLRDGAQHRKGGSRGYGAIAKEGPEGPIASLESLRCAPFKAGGKEWAEKLIR